MCAHFLRMCSSWFIFQRAICIGQRRNMVILVALNYSYESIKNAYVFATKESTFKLHIFFRKFMIPMPASTFSYSIDLIWKKCTLHNNIILLRLIQLALKNVLGRFS